MYKDGNGATYDATEAKFTTTPFGKVLPAGKSLVADLTTEPYYTPFNFGTAAVFAAKADNSVAGEMRDCGECHVGGGLMEYMIDPAKTTSAAYNANERTSLRDYVFGTAVTAFNALIDVFNTDKTKRGEMWTGANGSVLDVHGAIGCMGCHERTGSKTGTNVGVVGQISNKQIGRAHV